MKGVILAGGLGTRLQPLTLITNKHLLPVYDRPMILYPLETLKRAGLEDIIIICGKEYGGHFMNFLGSGRDCGVKLSYALQHGSGGIPEALSLAENFVGQDKMAVILGDNVFEDDFSGSVASFSKEDGARVFIKIVEDPRKFGVAEIQNNRIIKIEEKPKEPKTKYATVGFYLYGPDVFDKIKRLKPSARGELEITDVNNMYIQEEKLFYDFVKCFWSDVGSFESLLRTTNWVADRKRSRK